MERARNSRLAGGMREWAVLSLVVLGGLHGGPPSPEAAFFAHWRGQWLLLPISAFSQCSITSHLASESSTPHSRGRESEQSTKKEKYVKILLTSVSRWRVSGTPGVRREPHTGSPGFVPIELLPLPPSPSDMCARLGRGPERLLFPICNVG